MFSLRYANERNSARFQFMRLCGWLQGKKVVALRSDPEACARVLASSNTKGQFIEQLIACPAWLPVFSIESVDGDEWRYLAKNFRDVYARLDWQRKIGPLTRAHVEAFAQRAREDDSFILDAEQISRVTANIFFELVFGRVMTRYEEDVFYRASLEWRKEIAIKASGSKAVKTQFWSLLTELIEASPFAADFQAHSERRDMFLSVFAQPLILSPQINFSDIFSTVFRQLRKEPALMTRAVRAAESGEIEFLRNICLEAIRLEHPFPVLEREMTNDLTVGNTVLEAGTQVFIMLDEFQQDATFDPDRWTKGTQNPYRSMPFGAGPRVCLGKALAQEMLGELLAGILGHFPMEQVRPSENHLFSGRDNDGKDTLRTSIYQLRIFGDVLARSFGYRRARGRGACPFTGQQAATGSTAELGATPPSAQVSIHELH
ncbi:MAG TPA: cytochrome P450 [Labilithrix sp.]|jgi:hypothetical protein|nr:cytochrome P450 [Labilithrix sp.]